MLSQVIFIPFYLIFLDLMVPMHQGNLMSPTVSLELFLIHMLILPWVMVFLREGPAPPALFPLPVACIQDTACLLLFPNPLFTIMLPNLPIIHIPSLVLHLL